MLVDNSNSCNQTNLIPTNVGWQLQQLQSNKSHSYECWLTTPTAAIKQIPFLRMLVDNSNSCNQTNLIPANVGWQLQQLQSNKSHSYECWLTTPTAAIKQISFLRMLVDNSNSCNQTQISFLRMLVDYSNSCNQTNLIPTNVGWQLQQLQSNTNLIPMNVGWQLQQLQSNTNLIPTNVGWQLQQLQSYTNLIPTNVGWQLQQLQSNKSHS